MTQNQVELLKIELTWMDDAAAVLEHSLDVCQKMEAKEQYTVDELERFEALTARFSRLSDILIQKIFRLIDTLDLESGGTVRDRINRAEKKNLIAKASDFVEIRILRSAIAYEYLPQAVAIIFKQVMQHTPQLLDAVTRVKQYCQRYEPS